MIAPSVLPAAAFPPQAKSDGTQRPSDLRPESAEASGLDTDFFPAQREFLRHHPLRAVLGVPVISDERIVGGVSVVRFGEPALSLEEDESPFRSPTGYGRVSPINGGEDSIQVTAPSDLVVDDAVARLVVEFAGRVPAGTVAAVVRRSRHDLDSSPPAALPELTERLARQRLRDRLLVAGAAAGG